jgi:hypothetical protein
MKKCSKCGKTKGVWDFYRDYRSSDGLKSQCKECHNGYEKTRTRTVMKEWEEGYKFIDLVVSGDVAIHEVDDYVETWHEGNYTCTLHEYLGLTDFEYNNFLLQHSALREIVDYRIEEMEGEDETDSEA